jgi:hypothetical protein
MGKRSGAYKVFMGKPEENEPLGKPRHRWEIACALKKPYGRAWTGLIWHTTRARSGLL